MEVYAMNFMHRQWIRWRVLLACAALLAGSCVCMPLFAQTHTEMDHCPVTLPADRPVSGAPRLSDDTTSFGWYGSENLAVLLPKDGVWEGMGEESNYSDKFWWWRSGYSAEAEPMPDLKLAVTLMDGSAPVLHVANATNAQGNGWQAMLIGIEFPMRGCWEIQGIYQGSQVLTVVLRVASR
jgi:hypothetical protein